MFLRRVIITHFEVSDLVNKYDFCASQLSSETLDDAVTETDGASLRYDGIGFYCLATTRTAFVGVRLAGRLAG